MAEEKEFKDCIEEIEKDKVISNKTKNLLKDIEYDTKVLKEEVCENLEENLDLDQD